MVDAGDIVLEVRIDGKGGGDGPAGVNGLLNGGNRTVRVDLAGEGVFVAGKHVMGGQSIGVTLGGAHGGRLSGASSRALSRVRVRSLRAMVVAMRQRKRRAQVSNGSSLVVLATRHNTY